LPLLLPHCWQRGLPRHLIWARYFLHDSSSNLAINPFIEYVFLAFGKLKLYYNLQNVVYKRKCLHTIFRVLVTICADYSVFVLHQLQKQIYYVFIIIFCSNTDNIVLPNLPTVLILIVFIPIFAFSITDCSS